MRQRESLLEGSELLELMDAELEYVCGGHSSYTGYFSDADYNSDINNSYDVSSSYNNFEPRSDGISILSQNQSLLSNISLL